MERRTEEYSETLTLQLSNAFAQVVPSVKGTMGIINEAAHFTMLQAIDEIKAAGLYKFTTKKLFKQALAAYDDYKRNLLDPPKDESRFFDMDGLSENVRVRMKKGVTNKQYFEAWIDCATSAHKGYSVMLEALRYKYEKSLRAYKAKDPKLFSWLVVATMVMELAVKTYRDMLQQAAIEVQLPQSKVHVVLHRFCIERLCDTWEKACEHIFTDMQTYAKSTLTDRNLLLGHVDLHEAIAHQYKTMDCLKEGILDNADLYVNKKALAKELDEVNEYAEYMRNVEIK